MEHYRLQANETILFKENCRLVDTNEKNFQALVNTSSTELILTNLNLIFVNKNKKLFAKDEMLVTTYPVGEIKIYNDIPQLKQKSNRVEVFLISTEKTIEFFTQNEARKFINKAMDLLTGKTISTRVSDKVKGTLGLVDDTLGINTVGTIKTIAKNGIAGAVFGSFGKNSSPQATTVNKIMDIINVSKNIIDTKSETSTETLTSETSFDNRIEMIKKLKDLLDAGVITQEEFDAKKKHLLNI